MLYNSRKLIGYGAQTWIRGSPRLPPYVVVKPGLRAARMAIVPNINQKEALSIYVYFSEDLHGENLKLWPIIYYAEKWLGNEASE